MSALILVPEQLLPSDLPKPTICSPAQKARSKYLLGNVRYWSLA